MDKTYKDAYGLPLLRMTYNFTDQDRALFDYITKKIEEVAKAMNPKAMVSKPSPKDYNIVPYQTTHNTGGTITGKSPEDSVVNRFPCGSLYRSRLNYNNKTKNLRLMILD